MGGHGPWPPPLAPPLWVSASSSRFGPIVSFRHTAWLKKVEWILNIGLIAGFLRPRGTSIWVIVPAPEALAERSCGRGRGWERSDPSRGVGPGVSTPQMFWKYNIKILHSTALLVREMTWSCWRSGFVVRICLIYRRRPPDLRGSWPQNRPATRLHLVGFNNCRILF